MTAGKCSERFRHGFNREASPHVLIMTFGLEMSSTLFSVCLVTTAHGQKLLNELKCDVPLAILVAILIYGTGEQVHVFVEDLSGRW